jgi:hypothetical protein
MRRPVAIAVVLVALAASVAIWRCRGTAGEPGTTPSTVGGSATGARVVRSQVRPDPKSLPRATIAGTIKDERGAPIAAARVCVRGFAGELADELLREPVCATSSATGVYAVDGLVAAAYFASASAARYQPAAWGEDEVSAREIRVRGGERREGIDLVLRDGGIELRGAVSDLTGGPIEKARVWADGVTLTDTDANGEFVLWVKPGTVLVRASADGYADATDSVDVPKGAVAKGAPVRMDIVLTPESSLAGTVIDAASGEPIAGARVIVGQSEWGWDQGETTFTDERGAFRVSRLIPKRYVVVARTSGGFGRTEGSLLVGLAQHVDGVVVKVFPAFRIDGRILTADKRDCEQGQVSLQDRMANRFVDLTRAGDGSQFADGVLPGTYHVTIYCPGALVRERYEPIAIRDRDVTGLVWDVDGGATIRGRITTRAGAPVADAHVTASREAKAGEKASGGGTGSRRDGRYEIRGLRAGNYQLSAASELGTVAKTSVQLELAEGAIVERDLVLTPEDVGELAGTIVDGEGRPVADANVSAAAVKRDGNAASDPSGAAGTFEIKSMRPGEYLLMAFTRSGARLRKPGSTDDSDRGERVTIRAGQTTTVRLVVESLGGTITGTVVDVAGKPVGDAFITAARESDAAGATTSSAYKTRWNWNEKPVLTSPEGSFTLTNLAPGKYAIRAYRRGGGEAIAEHIAIGGTAKLTIEATGSIAGTVRRSGAPPDDFAVTVRDFASGYRRREQFYRTGGVYQLAELPKGKYVLSVEATGSTGQLEVELAEGQVRTGVDLALEGLITVTGRVVEHGTTTPVAGITMFARRVRGGGMYAQGDERRNVSTDAGRFEIKNVSPGNVLVTGHGDDDAGYATVQAYRQVNGSGSGAAATVDIGDVPILKRRLRGTETAGELGLKFAEQPLDLAPDKRERRVSYIDPQGPAAKTGIELGDVVIAIDGVDVRGENAGLAHTLLTAPPNTKLALGLARGVTVTIVLATP